jgi:phi LC3 family holin
MVMTLNLNTYMKRKPDKMKKISFKNADGSLNGKLIAGIISLLIVLIQQVFAMFGIKFTGDWSAIVAVINTVLTILGMLGVVTDVQTVTAPTVKSDEESPSRSGS